MTIDAAAASAEEESAQCEEPAPAETSATDTLKYHLLGPSLTKSGQDGVDQQRVSEIIYNASKGSRFFNNEKTKDKNLTVRINRILARKRQLERLDLSHDLRKADDYIIELELSRDLSQTIVHIDCDAFYAAVEELDRPELKDVPMAVGQGVLTTCNYHARRFGCRSAMAGFVAMKLCPQLVCLPLNFPKYTAKAKEVREVLAQYDSRFESASIDEAYLNITPYCQEHQMDPEAVVEQMRAEVHEKTHITISAGIAANAKLAKIASNRNKPNGQFYLPSTRSAILAFMKDLPTRKLNGVGRVFERELDAIGVKTCGDIYQYRGYLSKLFGDKAFHFLINCYLGLGRTDVRPMEEHLRKSVGTESTFRDMSGKAELRDKLRWIADELEKDMERTQFKGRTLVLKAKLHTYEVLTRQYAPPKAVWKADDLYNYALPMLAKLEQEIPGMTLRLMGLRCTNLVSMKKGEVDFFGMTRQKASTIDKGACSSEAGTEKEEAGEWEVWPEAEFEEAARQEREEEMQELEALSQEQQADSSDTYTPQDALEKTRHDNGFAWRALLEEEALRDATTNQAEEESTEVWNCPICSMPQAANDRAFNEHIDYCLSRGTIKEVVKSSATPPISVKGIASCACTR
ncbi:hypothetical protein BJ546DRAFT_848329 [Cryomyces antarcticus]